MEIARHWRLRKQRYRLIGDFDEFGNPRFPPGRTNPSSLLFTPGKPPSLPNNEVIDNVVVGNNHDN